MKELTLKELQNFCLEILQDVHGFCVNNNIQYSLYAGSMLGAIRHQGFIPWDDDVDIIMPRPDYDRFCKKYKSAKYHLINNDTDENCLIAFTRVCDLDKTIIDTYSPWCTLKTGCWIDIFPADGFPGREKDQYEHYGECISLRRKLIALRNIKACFHGSMKDRIKLLLHKIKTLNGRDAKYVIKDLLTVIQTYEYGKNPYWASLTNVRNRKEWKHHPIETFKTCSLMKFWNKEFYVMDGYDTVLSQRFGDYMKLPPKEEQKPKQSYIHFYWKEK